MAGGVAGWVQMLCQNLSEVEFVIWSIATTREEMSEYKYALPSNIIDIKTLYLGDNTFHSNYKKIKLQDKEREVNEKEEYIQKLKEKNEMLKKDNLNKQNQLKQLKEMLQEKEKEMPNTLEMQKELDNYEMRIKMLYAMVDQKDLNIKSVQQSYDSMYSSLHKTEKENEDYEMKYLQEKEKNDMLEKKINELNALARGVIESREDIMVNYERQLNKLNKEHHNQIKEKEMKSNDNTTI